MAKILRVHCCESDRHGGKPLYEAIVQTCRDLGIAGATVFRGLEGYGETAEIHRRHLTGRDQPVIIVIVDSDERIRDLTPVIERMMDTGMMATSDVEMIRVER
jgi:PII-like signaling protein